MSDPDEIERRFVRGRELVARGIQALAEGHRILRHVSGDVPVSRARGAIHQMVWDCERASGRRTQFFSQSGQDAFLDERVFEGKREGVFVEIGGFDGVTGSNCLFFELMRGWKGLMIEPAATPRLKAAEFRRCPCLGFAISEATGEEEFLEVEEGLVQMSGLTTSYPPEILERVEADARHEARRRSVRTKRLAQVLDSQYLRHVDFISLDVLGAELRVLRAFPFEEYDVRAWAVDCLTHGDEILELMHNRGYDRLEVLGNDDIFVRR